MPWLAVAAALLAAQLRLGLFHGFGPRGTDDQYYYAQARSLLLDGDLDLRQELGTLTPRPENVHTSTSARWDEPTPTGRVACKYPIGAPLMHLPFLALGQLVALAAAGLGLDVRTDGYATPCYVAWGVGTICWAVLAMWLAQRLVARLTGLGHRQAFALALAAFAGSPLLYHTIGDPFMAHVPAAAAACLFVAQALAPARRAAAAAEAAELFVLGVLGGLVLLVRITDGVHLALLAVPCAALLRRGALATVRGLAAAACGGLLALAPQLLAWHHLYGSVFAYSYRGEGFVLPPPYWWENTFGMRAGLFAWNPLWLPALAACLVAPRTTRWSAATILALFAVNSAWWCYTWGDTFGGRAFSTLYPWAAVGLGSLAVAPWFARAAGTNAPRLRRALALAVGAVMILWTLGMVLRMELLGDADRARGVGTPFATPTPR